MNYREVLEKAKEKEKDITCKDLNNIVYLYHFDRTEITYSNATLETIDDANGKWFIIYTEHHGFHVYHEEDLQTITVELQTVEKKDSLRKQVDQLRRELVGVVTETVRLQNRYDNMLGK